MHRIQLYFIHHYKQKLQTVNCNSNFDQKDISIDQKRPVSIISLLRNSFAVYETYSPKKILPNKNKNHKKRRKLETKLTEDSNLRNKKINGKRSSLGSRKRNIINKKDNYIDPKAILVKGKMKLEIKEPYMTDEGGRKRAINEN